MNFIVPNRIQIIFLAPRFWINLLGAGAIAILSASGGITTKPAHAYSPLSEITDSAETAPTIPSEATSSDMVSEDTAFVKEEETLAPQVSLKEDSLVQSDGFPHLNLILAQIPTLPPVPVPSHRIPQSSRNSSLGQLPAFPSASPSLIPGVGNNYNPGYGQYPNYPQAQNYQQNYPNLIPVAGNNYNPGYGQYPNYPQPQNYQQNYPNLVPAGASNYNPGYGQYPNYPQPQNYQQNYQNQIPVAGNNYNPGYGQYPNYPQPQNYQQNYPNQIPVAGNNYNPGYGQYPNYPQPQNYQQNYPTQIPGAGNNYNPGYGQYSNYPQTQNYQQNYPTQIPAAASNYNPGYGQYPNYPQPVIVIPGQGIGIPQGLNNYNPGMGQFPNGAQTIILVPVPMMGIPNGLNNYNPGTLQPQYNPQSQVPLPPPLNPNPVGFNNYNPGIGQSSYYPQSQVPFPAPVNVNPVSFNNYNIGMGGESPYYSQSQVPLPNPVNINPVNFNNYNPGIVAQSPIIPQIPPQYPNLPNPNIPNPNLPQINPTFIPISGQTPPNGPFSQLRSTSLRQPSLTAQGSFITQGGSSVGRARLSGKYPLSPQAIFGATLDVTSEASGLSDSPGDGININELYFATAPFADIPNLRFVLGQLDLTSYFDRNSFAKDGVTHFFNSAFQTNPALNAAGIASHPGVLVNWTLNDNIEAKAAAFSSSNALSDFSLDGFAGEIGVRQGNAIVRATYSTGRDGSAKTSFQEAFSIDRGDGTFGLDGKDREESYGINGEVFIPEWNMGVFGRYGKYINRELDESALTYNIGVSFVDVFTKDDRLGLAYGQQLSNNQGQEKPDVLELFYDFRLLPNMRIGFTLQQHNGLSETDVGVRVKTDFDVIPRN
ncbi:hypothetical protein [Limnofasciculus baicalensis]|uniref:Porin n=1 Tax=Limnofasciculus baicalensis BBK-W-15 TaxID=2699891 RepID=A0AAE3GSK5_9CYAN|nr:hypothetical protein [Limnofasciculus baicalensis]MCP2729083.1 hypothetical protein [Limnofasciculus baicalensis BBK-W-15]